MGSLISSEIEREKKINRETLKYFLLSKFSIIQVIKNIAHTILIYGLRETSGHWSQAGTYICTEQEQ